MPVSEHGHGQLDRGDWTIYVCPKCRRPAFHRSICGTCGIWRERLDLMPADDRLRRLLLRYQELRDQDIPAHYFAWSKFDCAVIDALDES